MMLDKEYRKQIFRVLNKEAVAGGMDIYNIEEFIKNYSLSKTNFNKFLKGSYKAREAFIEELIKNKNHLLVDRTTEVNYYKNGNFKNMDFVSKCRDFEEYYYHSFFIHNNKIHYYLEWHETTNLNQDYKAKINAWKFLMECNHGS